MKDNLIELLNKSFEEQHNKRGLITAKHTADYLLANGVTIPKTGHWIIRITSDDILAECSECRVCGNPHWKVCPVCETRMVNINESCND